MAPRGFRDQIVENSAPGIGGFITHVLNREQHLLAVRRTPMITSSEIEVAFR